MSQRFDPVTRQILWRRLVRIVVEGAITIVRARRTPQAPGRRSRWG